jgi:hypothetical protein
VEKNKTTTKQYKTKETQKMPKSSGELDRVFEVDYGC